MKTFQLTPFPPSAMMRMLDAGEQYRSRLNFQSVGRSLQPVSELLSERVLFSPSNSSRCSTWNRVCRPTWTVWRTGWERDYRAQLGCKTRPITIRPTTEATDRGLGIQRSRRLGKNCIRLAPYEPVGKISESSWYKDFSCADTTTELAVKNMSSKRKSNYELYLNSGHWKQLRELKFDQSGRFCRGCRTTKNLVCHHLVYRDLISCTPKDLVVLCQTCHGDLHKALKFRRGCRDVKTEDFQLDLLRWYKSMNSKQRRQIKRELKVARAERMAERWMSPAEFMTSVFLR